MADDITMSMDPSNAHRLDENLEGRHQVFLSHSGAQKAFVEQLCLDIERWDICPFFDQRQDSLPPGENIPTHIFDAVKKCRVGVVILSEEYFTRTKWPMLELVAMVNSKVDNTELIIIPVFLGISRKQCRDVTNQRRWKGVWDGWASCGGIDVEEWLRALEIFGPTKGICFDGLSEVKCRQEIVDAIRRLVPTTSSVWNDSSIQGRSRFCNAIWGAMNRVELSPRHGIRLVGLYGVGGIGKSTICKALCNNLFMNFRGRVCHVELGAGNELELVREMLRKLTDIRDEVIGGYNEGQCRELLRRHMSQQRVFLAIDNVSDNHGAITQAKSFLNLVRECNSIVMVTARSLDILLNLSILESDCLEMPELNIDEAKALLLQHSAPYNDVSEELIARCVQRCYFRKGDGISHHYHPLALRVLGVQLGYDAKLLNEQLGGPDTFNQLQEREHPIFSILRRSFDTLKPEDQLLFMDVALFYPEEENGVYRSCNVFEWLSMVHGVSMDAIMRRLQGLKRKSLIEVLGDGRTRIGMHDLWREFCEMETRGGNTSCRLWVYELHGPPPGLDPVYRPEESSLSCGGWEKLQRICLRGRRMVIPKEDGTFDLRELKLTYCSKVTVLKLFHLKVGNRVLDLNPLTDLKSFVFLDRISKCFEIRGLGSLRNLVVLILDCIPAYQYPSYIEEVRCLTNLQELQLSHPLSRDATRKEGKFPDLSELISLRKVILRHFDGDCTVPGLSSRMTNLRCLHLHDCLGLRKCDGVGDLVPLEDLQLESCVNLEKLPNLQKLTRLRTLNIQSGGRIAAIPGLDDLVSLEDLHLRWCVSLEKLPNLRKLTRLRTLDITFCTLIEAIPGFEDLVALELLDAHFCENLTQALNLRKLTNLQKLYLIGSPVDALVGLGDSVNLNDLKANFAWLTEWYYYHLDLHKLTKLQRLETDGWGLARFPCGVHLANLEHLRLFECRRVDELAGGLDAPRLQSLEIDDADFIDVSGVGSFIALRSLKIRACQKLETVPDMHRLTRLELLELINCRSLRGWNGVSRLSAGVDFLSQQILTACGGACIPPQVEDMCIQSVSITEFPDLSNFPRLRLLSICDCQKLIRLTNSAPLSALEEIGLEDCGSLEELPDLSGSWLLRSLSVRGCGVEFTADETSMLSPLVDIATTSSDSSESDESN